MPRGNHVQHGSPRGVAVFVPARDGKQALAECSWRRIAVGVNIDDQRGPIPRARFASIHVQHNPAGWQAVEGFNGYHDVRFSKALWLMPSARVNQLVSRACPQSVVVRS